MENDIYRQFPGLPDRSAWPSALTQAFESGKYKFWKHKSEWAILMSLEPGDMVRVQSGGRVQARVAINLTTGETVHPTPGTPISQWEAEVFDEGEEYQRQQEELKNNPLDLSKLGPFKIRYGIPKDRRP